MENEMELEFFFRKLNESPYKDKLNHNFVKFFKLEKDAHTFEKKHGMLVDCHNTLYSSYMAPDGDLYTIYTIQSEIIAN